MAEELTESFGEEKSLGNEFVFSEVLYTAVRTLDSGEPISIDLKDLVAEIDVFENIEKPYLTAKIVIIDDSGILSEAKVKGTELIKITIGRGSESEETDTSPYFTLDFKLVSIISQEKLGDRTELFVINCISQHAYNDAAVKVSKSYTGKIEKICSDVLKNYLDVELLYMDRYISEEGSAQGVMKVILPYISPLESVSWLTERATDSKGTPFFIWSTVWDQMSDEGEGVYDGMVRLRLGNFLTMVEQGLIATQGEDSPESTARAPFIYSQAFTNEASTKGIEEQGRIIKNIKINNVENTLEMMRAGAVGSTISSLDTYTSLLQSKLFQAKQLLESINSGTENGDVLLGVLDQKDKITFGEEEKDAGAWSSRERSVLTSYGTYQSINSYHDAPDGSSLLDKVRPSSIFSMLERNKIDITVTGITLLKEKLGVGDIIELVFKTSNTDNFSEVNSNTERSGYYLIQACRHIMKGSVHDAVLSVCKVAETKIVVVNNPYEDSFLDDADNDTDEGFIDF